MNKKNEFEKRTEELIDSHLRKWPKDQAYLFENVLERSEDDICLNSPTFYQKKIRSLDKRNDK